MRKECEVCLAQSQTSESNVGRTVGTGLINIRTTKIEEEMMSIRQNETRMKMKNRKESEEAKRKRKRADPKGGEKIVD